MMKSILGIVVLVVVLLVAGGVAIVYYTGQSGESGVERWVGEQIQLIVNSYLKPRFSFGAIDYQAPGTVRVTNLKLSADDPANPGQSVDVIQAKEATISLGQIPEHGQPILIERITLVEPIVRIIAGPNGGSPIGLTDMLKVHPLKDGLPPAGAPQLSDIFKIRRIEVRDGTFLFDPRQENSEPMLLDQINSLIEVNVASTGQYALNLTFGRKPILEGHADASLDLDTLRLSNVTVQTSAMVDEEKLGFLPTALQSLLKKYQAKGSLEISGTADIPLRDMNRARAQGDLKLAQAYANFGRYHIPLDSVSLQTDFRDSRLNIRKLLISVVQGQLVMNGEVLMNKTLDSKLEFHASGLRLEELLANKEDVEKGIRGKIAVNLTLEGPLKTIGDNWPATRPAAERSLAAGNSRWGTGDVSLSESKLANIPILTQFVAALAQVTKIVGGKPGGPNDRLQTKFDLVDDRLQLSDIYYVDGVIGARGKGNIWFDQRLDLTLNGGPIERVQELLGRFGEAMAKVTDAIAAYHVTGTLKEPKITIKAAPGFFNTIGKLGDIMTGGERN